MNSIRFRIPRQMITLACGLFLVLGLAVLPALSSPSLPATIRMPTLGTPASWMPIAALVAGIVILVVPKVFQYVVAIYFILIGVIGLLGR